jgi:phenylalanyl-tRNA synthetase alpha chain
MSSDIFNRIRQMVEEMNGFPISSAEELESFRITYLGSKNQIKPLFGMMKDIEADQRKEFGQVLNEFKEAAELRFVEESDKLEATVGSNKQDVPDLSAPPEPYLIGSRHPVSIVINRITDIFKRIGYQVVTDREIETEWYNFTALNTPDDHPARDMTDTYYVGEQLSHVLRSQTSTVQVHVMENQKPPIRIISPGRVYRNETISARSHCQFHQIEGLYIDEGVSFADLKQTLLYFAREMFGPETEIRLRPSYFPFTEPSAEMDVYWGLNNESDYRITKGTGWLEVMGCGMVDPAVLENCGIDSSKYSGFAFGMGIERQAMLQYKITDIRSIFENDVRFLRQFKTAL